MLELLADPQAWASLLTLTVLEIVLGIDNIIFISIVVGRLPAERQLVSRRIGLAAALVLRILLLSAIAWLVGLTAPLVTIHSFVLSWRDVILLAGGLFLLVKGTREIHESVEGEDGEKGMPAKVQDGFAMAIVQIMMLDLVFSLDSVITAIGMAQQLPIMITAVVIAMGVMLVAAGPVGDFINRHPTTKMLALSFLLLVGVALIADGMHFHIPRGYLYFAIAFSAAVEALNLMSSKRRAQ